MKKSLLIIMIMITGTLSALAQGGGFQRPPLEERVKNAMEKMKPLNLDKEATAKVDTIFTEFYKAQDKAFEEMRSSGSFDREAMAAKRKELSDARDEKLKKVLSETAFKKFKDEIEPSLRPQRPGGN